MSDVLSKALQTRIEILEGTLAESERIRQEVAQRIRMLLAVDQGYALAYQTRTLLGDFADKLSPQKDT